MKESKESKLNKKVEKKSTSRIINSDIFKISIFFCAIFIALMVWLVYFVGFRSSAVLNNSYNRRTEEMKKKVVRGEIYAKDGTVLAYTETDEKGNEIRIYPYENITAHVVGFESNGGLGIEASYNYNLLSSNINIFSKISNEFQNIKNPGDSLNLTIDINLQSYISSLLEGAGDSAAIAMDPDTGEVLALVSKPDFNPNTISDEWDSIVNDENNSVLLNRATQGLYAPGSTFKIFTMYEYVLEHPSNYKDYLFNCEGTLEVNGAKMNCYSNTAHGEENIVQSLSNSCNCSFSNIGLSLDLVKFQDTLNNLFFNDDIPIDIEANQSSYVMSANASTGEIMQTAIGQGNTLCTPAHLALIVSAIANKGVLMKPHIVSTIVNDDGNIVNDFRGEKYGALFTPLEAEILKDALNHVVTEGTGWWFNGSIYTAYGKTGTAETVSNFNIDTEACDHSWFVGGAELDGKKIVMCLIIEKAQDTWGSAVQFSKEIFDYYYTN